MLEGQPKRNKPLILRYFREGHNKKMISSIGGKIYFAADHLQDRRRRFKSRLGRC